jgi:serine/threonine protein kinase
MPLVAGTQLGPYEITAPLGAGGMGEVYRARDTRLDRTVAIKILPTQFSSDPVRKQRFEREAKTISSLNHPHICVLYDVGNQDGMDYLVMECVEGETLARCLEKGPLPLDQVLKYGAQIAEGLDKAHRSSVVHRDLKPQAANKLKNRLRFRSENGLHHQIPARIPNSHRDRCLMHIHPNILGVIHEGAPCCR